MPPLIALAALLCSACTPDENRSIQVNSEYRFVGSDQCQSCHVQEFSLWQGSHHQLAMQPANSASVLGDFSGVSVPYFGTTATFSKHDEQFIATVENASGELEEFEVTHTFGVAPLQQYLVDAPGGRKQALQFAWDSRAKDDGGQRWFHLYPAEYIGTADPLHWTGLAAHRAGERHFVRRHVWIAHRLE